MLNFTFNNDNSAYTFYVSLKSNWQTTITNSYFLFRFTNRVTNDVVDFYQTNISTTDRYGKFSIVVNTTFLNQELGLWTYEIYGAVVGQTGPTTTLLENGYMNLKPATTFVPTKYNQQSNQFVTYNG